MKCVCFSHPCSLHLIASMSQGRLGIFGISCCRWHTLQIFLNFSTYLLLPRVFIYIFAVSTVFLFICLFSCYCIFFFFKFKQWFANVTLFTFPLTGAHLRTGTTAVQQTFRLKKLFKHEGFDMRQLQNDIALLQLERPIAASEKVNTVCLPASGSRIPAGTQCYITGFLWIEIFNCCCFIVLVLFPAYENDRGALNSFFIIILLCSEWLWSML